MRYMILCLGSYIYAVSKEHLTIGKPAYLLRTNEVVKELNNVSHYMSDSIGIVATNDPSLNLPLLPTVEESVQSTALKLYPVKREWRDDWNCYDEDELSGEREAYIEGYKAASAKQFTEENLRSMYFDGLLDGRLHGVPDDKEAEEQFQEKLKSINPKPVAVEFEIVKQFDHDKKGKITTIDESEAYHGAAFIWIPAIDENNYVKVKQWCYE